MATAGSGAGGVGEGQAKASPQLERAAGSECVDARDGGSRRRLQHGAGSNARWVYYALPEGTPPAGGWPVFLSLVTDSFAAPADAPPKSVR
eukprot:SAG31_NODE_1065_length_10096_cov_7.151530_14_plen_91_part_00